MMPWFSHNTNLIESLFIHLTSTILHSFTPSLPQSKYGGKYLMLGSNAEGNRIPTYLSVIIHPPLNLSPPLHPFWFVISVISLMEANWQSIAQFSKADADAYVKYEIFLGTQTPRIYPLWWKNTWGLWYFDRTLKYINPWYTISL